MQIQISEKLHNDIILYIIDFCFIELKKYQYILNNLLNTCSEISRIKRKWLHLFKPIFYPVFYEDGLNRINIELDHFDLTKIKLLSYILFDTGCFNDFQFFVDKSKFHTILKIRLLDVDNRNNFIELSEKYILEDERDKFKIQTLVFSYKNNEFIVYDTSVRRLYYGLVDNIL